MKSLSLPITFLGLLFVATSVGCIFLYTTLEQTKELGYKQESILRHELEEKNIALEGSLSQIAVLEKELSETKAHLEETTMKKERLASDLDTEKERNDAFAEELGKIGSTVGTLDKLSKIDRELLQKYSKVYFLNEHYMPEKLVEIPHDFVYRTGGDPEFFHAKAYSFLKDMIESAFDDGVKLWVVSAFRSYDEQRALKGAYTVTYGSGANTFSADQGYSEHQLGTTIDFTTENMGGGLTNSFEKTLAYEWLTKNAHKYGFVLSYPKDNAYYIFEPWHWRFIGTDLARDLHKDGKSFYDVDQREIDTYLISLFD